MRAGRLEMTKDAGADVTCHHNPGIIWVTSYWIKMLECVGIIYVSNKLQCNYLRSTNVRSRRGPNWCGYDKDEINDIWQDDGRCNTRTMGQCLWELESPRMTMGQMITSNKV